MTLSPSLPGPEEEGDCCDRCPRTGADVIWIPIWGEYLCSLCKDDATAAELRITLAEQRAIDERAREAS